MERKRKGGEELIGGGRGDLRRGRGEEGGKEGSSKRRVGGEEGEGRRKRVARRRELRRRR